MKFLKKSGNLLFYIIFLIIAYVVINLIQFSWYIVNPEGLWGFSYFLGILTLLLTAISISIFIVVFLIIGFYNIISGLPGSLNRKNYKNILKFIGVLIFIVIMSIFNFVWVNGFTMYLSKKMSDKYSYLNKSEKYFATGEYDIALNFAEEAYNKEKNHTDVSPFFLLTKIFSESDYAIKQNYESLYAAVINYAYCLENNLTTTQKAKSIFIEALNMANSPLLIKNKNYQVFPILSLSQLYLSQGNYKEAEIYFNKLVALSNNFEPGDIEYVCLSQELFAIYADRVGDYKRSAELRSKNVILYENSDSDQQSKVYLFILLRASLSEMIMGQIDKAGDYLIKSKPLADDRKNKVEYLTFLSLKGIYCEMVSKNNQGNEAIIDKNLWDKIVDFFSEKKSLKEIFTLEAENCFLKVTDENRAKNDGKSVGYAQSLSVLATFYTKTGHFEKVQSLYKEALKIIIPFKENNKDIYNKLLLNSLISNFYFNENDKISENISQVEDYYFNAITANYLFFTEDQKELFVAKIEKDMMAINSIYVNIATQEFTKKLYNNVLALKNIALFSNQNTRDFLSNCDVTLKHNFYSILRQKDSLTNLISNSNIDLNKLQNNITLKEKEIVNKISANASYQTFNPRDIKWEVIRDSLKSNEVSIEFINVPSKPYLTDSIEYYAIVTTKNSIAPELVHLFKENHLIKILNKGGITKERIDSIYNKDTLYNLIWKPLEIYLTSASKVFVSVSGLLYRISFPALLVQKKVDVILLSSTRQIAMKKNSDNTFFSPLLFGGIDYKITNNINPANPNSRSTFLPLKYSKVEVENIRKIFSTQNIRAKLISETSATVDSFKILCEMNFNIVHLSTHGFYYRTNYSSTSINILNNFNFTKDILDNPLSRCGLLFAGANEGNGSNTNNDGILTGLEISKLDLSNVDMIVLSACETGLGDIEGSEGVYGLQRAFKLAGVKSMLVSLWNVDDERTSELMTSFYKYLIPGKFSKSESLKKAQLDMSKNNIPPYYWAGFVLIED